MCTLPLSMFVEKYVPVFIVYMTYFSKTIWQYGQMRFIAFGSMCVCVCVRVRAHLHVIFMRYTYLHRHVDQVRVTITGTWDSRWRQRGNTWWQFQVTCVTVDAGRGAAWSGAEKHGLLEPWDTSARGEAWAVFAEASPKRWCWSWSETMSWGAR